MNRILKEIVIAVIIGGLGYYLTESLKLALVVSIVAFGLLNLYKPEKRYWRAFWKVFIAFTFTNAFSLSLIRNLSDGTLAIKYEDSIVVTIVLGLLLFLFPILDYKERNAKQSTKEIAINGNDNIAVKDINNSKLEININARQKDNG